MERKVSYFIVVGIILLFGGTISAAADVTVTKVWPDKLRYDFETPGKITITLKNASQVQQRAGKLTLTLHSALDREETLYDETVELAAGETKAIDVPFTTGSKADGAEYGYEALAVWSVDGKPVSSAREFFMITDSPLKIGHLTIPTAATDHRHGWWGGSVARGVQRSQDAWASSLPGRCCWTYSNRRTSARRTPTSRMVGYGPRWASLHSCTPTVTSPKFIPTL